MPRISQLAFRWTRRVAQRALSPVLKRRHGYPFVWRRALAKRLEHGLRDEHVARRFEWVSSGSLEQRGALVHEIHAQQHVLLEPLPRLDPWLEGAYGWGVDHRIPAQRVVELEDGIVFGTQGWIGPAPDAICADLGNSLHRGRAFVADAARQALEDGLVNLAGTTVSLLQFAGNNYYHWMLQGLPRLSLVLDSVGASTIDRFLVDPEPASFVLETLERAGVPPDRVVRADRPVPAYRAERLVAATMLPVGPPPPSWATRFVRGLFPDSLERDVGALLYVERGASKRRRLVNEDRVLNVLTPYGFRPVTMDGRTVADQAALFAGARCVVAPHGAALTNVVFAQPSTSVLELLAANAPACLYAVLARHVGLRYDVLVGSEARPPRRLRTFIGDADLVIDAKRLAATVSSMLAPDQGRGPLGATDDG